MTDQPEPKWIGKSKTVWGVILMAIPAFAQLAGWEWTTEQGMELDVIASGIFEVLGMILAIVGRYTAKGPVYLKGD